MTTILQKRPRRTPKSKLRALLPKTARSVVWEGEKFVALPEQEVDEWLEDLIDGIEATVSLREGGPSLSQEEACKLLGLA